MLEKNAEKLYFDAHFHFSYSENFGIPAWYRGCSCAHSKEEWDNQLENAPDSVVLSYGIHPQSCGYVNIKERADFLEKLLHQRECEFNNSTLKKRFLAIGETGFDYFTDEFMQFTKEQEEAWKIQLELAIQFKMPLVVHCRKANHKLFEYSNQLKKLPSVLFHSFMGTPIEANSLLKRGINGFFSFGKQILNNNKKVIACVQNLPLENLLLETDAPFQYLKNESYTAPGEIERVYNAAFDLRTDCSEFYKFCSVLERNYLCMFRR